MATPYLDEIAERLGDLDEGYRASRAFYDALLAYELLEPFSLEVTLDDGSVNSLVGFHIIDEAKLRALDAEALGALHGAGHLMPMFMALASLSQLSRSEEHTSELQSLMRISYAVFCLKKKPYVHLHNNLKHIYRQ